jgi:hypothetical protein
MDNDETGHEYSALGICRCLRMLAEEAASMNLPESARTLRDAIRICERESGLDRARAVAAISVLLN